MNEIIKWIRPEDEMPDEDILVLVVDANGEVFPSLRTEGQWYDWLKYCTWALDPEARIDQPKYWADIPAGPEDNNAAA